MGLRIAIFDDNKNIRESISMLLATEPQFDVVGSFSHVLDCIDDIRSCKPDIVLMDIEMPGMTGIDAVVQIKKEFPHIQVLMQTVFEDDDRVFDSICAGASGYILKNTGKESLLNAIYSLQAGSNYLGDEVSKTLLNGFMKSPNVSQMIEKLSGREKEVLECIATGSTTHEIAEQLFISKNTVETHRKNLLYKLKARNTAELVNNAYKQRLIQ